MSEVEKANAAWEESLASGAFDSDKDIFMSGWHKGRAEAIASTEAKFRELADMWYPSVGVRTCKEELNRLIQSLETSNQKP